MVEAQLVTTRLAELEQVIERGLQTFVDVGTALLEIRDNSLYREQYGTFENYCRERWGFASDYARKQMRAAEVIENLRKTDTIVLIPTTEGQARPLTGLPTAVQPEAWQKAVDTAPNGKVTAKHVENVAREYKQTTTTKYVEYDDGWGPSEDDVPAIEYVEATKDDLPDEWAAGAVGLDRDWSDEELEDYAGAHEVVTQPQQSSNGMAVHFSSETPEHYTPVEIIHRVHSLWGEIDLDPCSNLGVPNVTANNHFTVADDGLAQPWFGKVYMNPPYGDEIKQWTAKLAESIRLNYIEQAIALVPARTDTGWFAELDEFYPLICYVRGRLKFVGSANGNAPFPSAIFYFGDDLAGFVFHFGEMGRIQQTLNPEMYGG